MIQAQTTSDGDYPHIETLQERVNSHFQRGSISGDAKQAANEWLQRHRHIRAVADNSRGYEDFVRSYIQREQSRHERSDSDEPGNRNAPLCTCGPQNCPLKQGTLPEELSTAPTINDGIRQFRERPHHDGYPRVLSEARSVYAEVMVAVEEVLQIAETVLKNYDEDGYRPPEEAIEVDNDTAEALKAL